MKLKPVIPQFVSLLFIFLWIYASAGKLLEYEKFRLQLGQSPLLTRYAAFVAWFIPGMEILISALLVWAKTRLTGLFLSFSMMVLFSGYIVAITRFSDHVPCSCGGILEKLDWNTHLIINVSLILLALVGLTLQHSQEAHRDHSSGDTGTKNLQK